MLLDRPADLYRELRRKPASVRVVDFLPDSLDATRVYIDLVGLGERAARERLLAAVRTGRAKPTTPPPFPPAPSAPVPFPGRFPAIWNVPARNPDFPGTRRHRHADIGMPRGIPRSQNAR